LIALIKTEDAAKKILTATELNAISAGLW